ncbi:MAG TPA: hypothetical protein VK327_11555, partial [Candidatus Paceibacterota bacterium]|nr:hypothetical protein [Candidatus Paceibacterota bacterium]
QVALFDYNVYMRSGDSTGTSLLVWSPVSGTSCVAGLNTIEELRRLNPEFESHGLFLGNHYGSVFKSSDLKRYELNASLSKLPQVPAMPSNVQRWLDGLVQSPAPGAYPQP